MKIDYNFLRGDISSVNFCPLELIDTEAPEKPGLYVWKYRTQQGKKNPDETIMNMYSRESLYAEIKGHIRYKYKGKLKKDISEQATVIENDSFFRSCQIIASPPLYIGISMNLNHRLSRHKAQLISRMNQSSKVAIENEVIIDSDEESSCFGERMAVFLSSIGIKVTKGLYVEYAILDNESNIREIKKKLLSAEYLLNSCINPAFGRK